MPEGLGIPAAVLEIFFHDGAGTGAVLGVNVVGIVVQPELGKALLAPGEDGNLLLLLLTAQLQQTLAHVGAQIAGAAADFADGRLIQKTLLKVFKQEQRPLLLQLQILNSGLLQ